MVIDGVCQNMDWHQKRYDISNFAVFGAVSNLFLSNEIKIPDLYASGIVKLRLIYDHKNIEMEFEKYRYKNINSLKLIYCDDIEYEFKYQDRRYLNILFDLKEDCDDILIIKNGEITDTSSGNIVFYDGMNWFTPSSFLLNGTTRQRLLQEGKIKEKKLMDVSLKYFNYAKVINAFRDLSFEDCIEIEKIM